MIMAAETCPGCGVRLPTVDGPVHRYMASSPACWAAYGRVLAREYGDPALLATHRLSVDAYAVQHPGGRDQQSIQSVALHLARLSLTLGHDLPPAAVNEIAVRLGRIKHRFIWLEPPAHRGAVTVADVEATSTPDRHAQMVRAWSRSAFEAWRDHHLQVATWTKAIAAA